LFFIHIPYHYFILIIAITNVIALLPITIHGLGTREVAIIGLFSIFNVPQENALGFSFFWFITFWLIPSIVGSFVTINESRKNPNLPDKKRDFIIDKNLAEQFTEYMEKYIELYLTLAKKIQINISKSVKKPIIVDLGTGPGLLSLEINKLMPDTRIVGIDPSIHMLTIANRKFSDTDCKQCNLVMARIENIPFKKNFADAIVSRLSLSSWEKPKKGFSEIFRILKPGGILVLEVLNKKFPKWRLNLIKLHMKLNKAGKNVTKYHIDYYKKAYSVKQVEQFLIETGFDIIEKDGKRSEWKFLIIAKRCLST
jgi:ubiquinone/menaquinone biosynthesis C-methylase UbiE